jgi:hypothetical protein
VLVTLATVPIQVPALGFSGAEAVNIKSHRKAASTVAMIAVLQYRLGMR